MKKIYIANWKSNKNLEEVVQWLDEFKVELNDEQEVIIAPPYPFLSLMAEKVNELSGVSLAVQNLSSYPAGSYTGEVCIRNLEGLGVKYAILGHSERRRYLRESHQDVANKVDQCLGGGITPILCIDIDYLEEQAAVIPEENLKRCVAVYEPPEAISTNQGENASIEEVVAGIKKIKEVFGEALVLYGGSVTPENDDAYSKVTDGVLVGGASLDAKVFAKLIATHK